MKDLVPAIFFVGCFTIPILLLAWQVHRLVEALHANEPNEPDDGEEQDRPTLREVA